MTSKNNLVSIRFQIDSGFGEFQFSKEFSDAEIALCFLSGYLGKSPLRISNFEVEIEGYVL